MASDDHVAAARDVFDLSAQTYAQFVGPGISPTTECPFDLSLLMAFVGLIKGQAVNRVADVGCGPGRVAAFLADHGLDVIGVDVSREMLAIASTAHPRIEFEQGQLDALPIQAEMLAGAVCWYSIIYTPPDRLSEAFSELARVLMPGGRLLLAFQADGEPVRRQNAFDTHLPLTSYRHSVQLVTTLLEETGFKIDTTALRAPELVHETSSQGFVMATGPLS